MKSVQLTGCEQFVVYNRCNCLLDPDFSAELMEQRAIVQPVYDDNKTVKQKGTQRFGRGLLTIIVKLLCLSPISIQC